MTSEEELQRAGQAAEILRNPLFKEAVRDVEEALLAGIKQSAFKDADLREKLCQQYINLHSVIDRLKSHIETGKLAEETIRRKTISERVKAAVGF